jgi:dihydroorotase
MTRRRFLGASALGAAGVAGRRLEAGDAPSAPPGEYDVLILGGVAIDPGQGLHARRDVAIRDGRIAAVEPAIPAERGKLTVAAAGLLVLPGLIDMHAHVYDRVTPLGLSAETLAPLTGATTVVDAGSAGHDTYDGFQRWVVESSTTRTLAFLNISAIGLAGFPVGEMLNLDYADVERAAATVAEHADVLLGLKVRQSRNVVGGNGLVPLRRAIAAAERAGTGARVMCHVGDVPGPLSDLLDLLRPGDVLTHVYSGAGNNVVQDGRVLPAALAAQRRGVLMDVGHGGGSFDYTVAETALRQGLVPDTIGSDLHGASIRTAGKPYLPWVMSKLLNLGLSLDAVVSMATSHPAKVIGRVQGLGTLAIGAPGDVSLLELLEAPVAFADTRGHERAGTRYLRPVETFRAGRSFGRLLPAAIPYP